MTTKNNNAPFLAGNDALDSKNKLQTGLEKNNSKPRDFQYLCSFCWRDLPDNGVRFDGFGVCPSHLKLAETIVDLLRGHRARYFNSNFGGPKR
jgi:hypothetical protein